MWKQLAVVFGLACTALGQSWPYHTSSRWVLDKNNQRVKLRCVNWAGHMEAHIPEGLQHQSIDYIASFIANNGFNCVRLTYSVDQALSPDQKVSDAFIAAAAATGINQADMTNLYNSAVQKNPFLANATTQETYGKIIEALGSKGVAVVLDNHVSKAGWCCNPTDGNGWWDEAAGYNDDTSKYFNTSNWEKSLTAMSTFSKSYPNVVGMSLRNELRPNLIQDNKVDWYKFVTRGANAIHAQNSDLLIVIGGTRSAADMRMVFDNPLDTSGWKDRTVWEFHAYWWTYPIVSGWCPFFNSATGFYAGFLLEQGKAYTGPLWLSEFGVGLQGGPHDGISDVEDSYLNCLTSYMQSNDAEWAYWAIQGSYYVRDGKIDTDESYGLLDSTWSTWRNTKFTARLGTMWNITQTP